MKHKAIVLLALVMLLMGCAAHGDSESRKHVGEEAVRVECRVDEGSGEVVRQQTSGYMYGSYGSVSSSTDGTNLVRCEVTKSVITGEGTINIGDIVIVKSPDKKASILLPDDRVVFVCAIDLSEGVAGARHGIWELDGCRLESPVLFTRE